MLYHLSYFRVCGDANLQILHNWQWLQITIFVKKISMKPIALIFALVFSASLTFAETPMSQKMVASHGLGDFKCNTVLKSQLSTAGWDYVSGLVANAVLKAWEQYPEKTDYYDAVKTFAVNCTKSDGSMIINAYGGNALGDSNIDDLAAGKIFFTLYKEETKKGNTAMANRFRSAATVIRNKLKYQHSRIAAGLPGAGGFYHKASYPSQMWLDGLYMGPAVYAQWQNSFGYENPQDNNESWSDIALQFKTIHKYTYDSVKQLNYHGWAAIPTDANAFWSNKANPYKGCSKEFWGRGMGWFFAALADVLELMPKDHADYNNLLAIYRQVAAGLKRWQDPDSGVWFQLLQYDETKRGDGKGDNANGQYYNVGTNPNYLESSCSCMFTYAFFKGVRLGYLDKATYLPVAEKAYQGLLKTFIVNNGSKIDIIQSCASAGLGPSSNLSRTGTANYYLCGSDVKITQNEGKAIGTFIMASLENELNQMSTAIEQPATSGSDKTCYFEAPSNGVYLIRYFSGCNTVAFKQAFRTGSNLICLHQPDDFNYSDNRLEVFTGNGMLVTRTRVE
jgi:unsaturated rhamnogalacturonyl hydrolase